MPSHSGMSLGRGIQGTDLPPTSYPPPPPPAPPQPPSHPPQHPSPPLSPSVAVPPSAAVWSMPLCRVLWFFSINYLRKKNNGEKRRLYRAYTALYDENRGNYSVHKYRVITSIVI